MHYRRLDPKENAKEDINLDDSFDVETLSKMP